MSCVRREASSTDLHPVEDCGFFHVYLWPSMSDIYIMDSYPVGTEGGWTPSGRECLVLSLVVFFRRGNFLDLCACLIKLDLRVIDFPLEVGECLVECRHFRLLDQKVFGVFCDLRREWHVGVSQVSDCCPVLRRGLSQVVKGLFDYHPVVGSISALAHCLLALAEVLLWIN